MTIILLSTNSTDHTITAAVDGKRYEYWLQGDYLRTELAFRRLLRLGAKGKALNLLKSHSWKTDLLVA